MSCPVGRTYDTNHPVCKSCTIPDCIVRDLQREKARKKREYREKKSVPKTGRLLSEHAESVTMNQVLDEMGIWFCHVPNEGKRSPTAAGILKAAGMKSGVPDFLIFDYVPNFPEARGVAIEMKRKKGGVVSENQKKWLETLTRKGWLCRVCNGAKDALSFLSVDCGFTLPAKMKGKAPNFTPE